MSGQVERRCSITNMLFPSTTIYLKKRYVMSFPTSSSVIHDHTKRLKKPTETKPETAVSRHMTEIVRSKSSLISHSCVCKYFTIRNQDTEVHLQFQFIKFDLTSFDFIKVYVFLLEK